MAAEDEIVATGGWCSPPTNWWVPLPARESIPPADLDGPPRPCEWCDGKGTVWRYPSQCTCSHCGSELVEQDCDDCDGTGTLTPLTLAEWERIKSTPVEPSAFPDVPVRRGGIRFPGPEVLVAGDLADAWLAVNDPQR